MNIEDRLRRAGIIIAIGLLIQFLSLLPVHPLAFIAFVGLGVPVMALGVIFFLLSLVHHSESAEKR
jgi:hypothetical protein